MGRYDFLLFDADNTLFDFDLAEHLALKGLLEARGCPFTPETEALYLSINRALWAAFDRGEVGRDHLVVERFSAFGRALGLPDDPADMNRDYLARLSQNGQLLPGAEALCRALAPRCTMAIVTNGLSVAQRGRIGRSPIAPLFSHVFISQEMGCQKPEPVFFDMVCRTLGIEDRSRALVVGDSLTADMRGGRDAGMDTLWYNPGRLPVQTGLDPTWQVQSLAQAQALLLPLLHDPPEQTERT